MFSVHLKADAQKSIWKKKYIDFHLSFSTEKKADYHSFWQESIASVDCPVLDSNKSKKNSFQ